MKNKIIFLVLIFVGVLWFGRVQAVGDFFNCQNECLKRGEEFYIGGITFKAGASAGWRCVSTTYATMEECEKTLKQCSSDVECTGKKICKKETGKDKGVCIELSCTNDSDCPTDQKRTCVSGVCSKAVVGGSVTPTPTSSVSTPGDGVSLSVPDASVLNKLGTTDLATIVGRFIKAALGILGSIALLMIIYGGLLWMTASGNAEKESKGLQTLVWAGIGVIVVFASYAIVDLVFEIFR